MQQLGLGFQPTANERNHTQELAFALNVVLCMDQDLHMVVYHNFKSKSPLKKTYSVTPPSVERLLKRGGYDHPPILTMDARLPPIRCQVRLRSKSSVSERDIASQSSVVSGNFFVEATGCNVDALTHECFQGRFALACTIFYIEGGIEWIFGTVKHNNGFSRSSVLAPLPPFRRGKDTLAIMAQYLSHNYPLTVSHAFFISVLQAAPNSTVRAIRGQTLVTDVNVRLFWPSLTIITAVLGGCCFVGLYSTAEMKYTKCDVLDVGISPEQVARLATLEGKADQERKAWYLQLHLSSPHMTVCTDSTKTGKWAEEEVQNKYRRRD